MSETHWRALFTSIREGFFLAEMVRDAATGEADDFRFIEINPAFEAQTGLSAAAVVGRTVREAVPGFQAGLIDTCSRVVETGEPVQLEVDVPALGGRWYEARIQRAEGFGRFAVLFLEITARKAAEAALSESEARFRATFEQAAVGIAHVGRDGRWLRVNGRLCEMLGYTQAELLEKTFQEVTHPDDLADDLSHVQRLAAGEYPTFSMEKRYFRKDGGLLWVNLTVSLVRNAAGAPEYFISVIEDIGERKRAESALRESEGRLRHLVATLDLSSVFVRDFAGTIRAWSQGCERLYGWSSEEALGAISHELLRSDFPVPLAEIEAALLRDGEWSGDLVQRTRDGTQLTVATRKVLRRDDAGQVVAVMESVSDVTALRAAKEELGQLNQDLEARVAEEVAARETAQAKLGHAERMQALGELAGGIAHDFNNVIQAVQGGVALIEGRADNPEGVRRLARMVLESADRGASITQRLLAFARRGDLRAEAVDATALLQGLRDIFVHTIGAAITVRLEADGAAPPVMADKGSLETVLVNLATNARDAMPTGGILTLSVAAATVPAQGRHPSELGTGAYVRIAVTDTGVGMDALTLARVLEPFFTTKGNGKGTGLGLPMAKNFAEQSGGALAIESAVGRGTTVAIWLPQAIPEQHLVQDHPPKDTADVQTRAGSSRVLLVDDDALVRETLTAQLEDAGFAVLAAESGTEALALLDSGESVDGLVTDLSMPGIDGLAVIRGAHKRRPGLPSVLLTGHTEDGAALAMGQAVTGPFLLLRKPITGVQLASHVAALVTAEPVAPCL